MRTTTTAPARHEGRTALAVLAALLWVLGFELLPGLHLAHHGELGAHSHGHASIEHADRGHHGAAHQHGDRHGDGHHHRHAASHHPLDPARLAAAARGEHGESTPAAAVRASIHDRAEDARGAAALSLGDLDHGSHALLHRGLAVATPPDAMPTIAEAAIIELPRTHTHSERVRSRAPLHARARGPPGAAECRSVDCAA